MADRIRTLLPLFVILVIIGSLINIGAIPGKQSILRFLGLARESQPEQGRPLDYVPERLLELAPPPGEEITYPTPSPGGVASTPNASPGTYPSPRIYPSPQTFPSPSYPNQPPPPPPPPEIFGARTVNSESNPPPPQNDIIGEFNNQSQSGNILETIKNFFSGIF